jgi:hypothetical protein
MKRLLFVVEDRQEKSLRQFFVWLDEAATRRSPW